MRIELRHLATVALACAVAACGGSGEGLDANGRPIVPGSGEPPPPGAQASIEWIQEHVFTPQCATCHAGGSAPVGLRLEDAQTSYDNLVGVRSTEQPTLFRVAAGNAADSYLVHKLEGRQTVGNQMPNGQPPLPEETIAVIRQWIDEGAAAPQ